MSKDPVAWFSKEPIGYLSEGGAERLVAKKQAHEQIKNFRLFAHDVPVYITPPQRTWVGLTQDELTMICDSMKTWSSFTVTDVYFAIEAKLKEKNT